jgi:flagellin-like hook-associated protein FlgL
MGRRIRVRGATAANKTFLGKRKSVSPRKWDAEMSDINLTKAVRQNLLSLQNTAKMMAKTQDRLATGNKVNTALDNPSNFFTSASLNARAGELDALLDSMNMGIKTLEAADNGLTSITKTLESMQSTLRQARQDKTFETASYTVQSGTASSSQFLKLYDGAFGTGTQSIDLTTMNVTTAATAGSATISATGGSGALGTLKGADTVKITLTVDGGSAQVVEITASDVAAAGNLDDTLDNADEFASILRSKINTGKLTGVEISNDNGQIFLKSLTSGTESKVQIGNTTFNTATNGSTINATTLSMGSSGVAGNAAVYDYTWKSVDTLVNEINNSNAYNSQIKASNDNGKLRIQNLSTQRLAISGIASDGKTDGSTSVAYIAGNSVRTGLASQFNELRDQLDKISDDASFNGVNLLRGDNLKITFNETGTSSIDIKAKNGGSVDANSLGVPTTMEASDLDNDAVIDGFLAKVKVALNAVRSQASSFGSNLSVVENRQNFTKQMMNTLQNGAGDLTLADMNEEAANMVALQTRQSLATSSLSMANQADQNVLQLLR